MKQTAVEYLIEEMQNRIPPFYAQYIMNMDEIYKKAKQMEKQQIIDALTYGNKSELMASQKMFAEQYYNETYGSKGNVENN